MKKIYMCLYVIILSYSIPSFAVDSDAVLGGVIGGGVGAAVGSEVGGRDGAIVGGAIGAAVGVAVATDDNDSKPKKKIVKIEHNHHYPGPIAHHHSRKDHRYYGPPGHAYGHRMPPGHMKHRWKHRRRY